jgi:hypothetical protein
VGLGEVLEPQMKNIGHVNDISTNPTEADFTKEEQRW